MDNDFTLEKIVILIIIQQQATFDVYFRVMSVQIKSNDEGKVRMMKPIKASVYNHV